MNIDEIKYQRELSRQKLAKERKLKQKETLAIKKKLREEQWRSSPSSYVFANIYLILIVTVILIYLLSIEYYAWAGALSMFPLLLFYRFIGVYVFRVKPLDLQANKVSGLLLLGLPYLSLLAFGLFFSFS